MPTTSPLFQFGSDLAATLLQLEYI